MHQERADNNLCDEFAENRLTKSVVGLRTLAIAALMGIVTWLAINLSRSTDGIAIVWLASGLLVGILLTSPHRTWPAYFVGALMGNLIGRAAYGDALFSVLIRGFACTLEACIVVYALRFYVGNVSDPENTPMVARVAVASTLVACAISALIVAAASSVVGSAAFVPIFIAWFASHTLGIVIFATLTVVARELGATIFGLPGRRWMFFRSIGLVGVTTLWVFSQSRAPILFLIYPPLLFAAFRHRFAGLVVGVTLVTLISVVATKFGSGPLNLIVDATEQQRTLLLQFFIAVTCLTALPVVVALAERGRLAAQLRESERNYRILADYSRDIVVRMRADGHHLYVSPAVKEVLGWEPTELAEPRWELIHADDRVMLVDAINTLYQTGDATTVLYRSLHKDGHYVWIEAQARRVPGALPGNPAEIIYSGRDVSKRVLAEQQFRRGEQRLRTIADAMPAKIAYVDAALQYAFVNAAYERAYRLGGPPLVGRTIREVLGEATYARRLPQIERALCGEEVTFEDEETIDGKYRCLEVAYIPQHDEARGEILGLHIMTQDVTRKKLQEQRWMVAAQVDSLTGLVNRAGFLARLESALAHSDERQTMLAVMYLDIDHFKQINDTYGHGIGDSLLKSFAERLSSVLRTSDVVGRLGGDEFTVISEGVKYPQYASVAAAKVVEAMRLPFTLTQDKLTLYLTTSIGVALSVNEASMTAAALLERADQALYEAKAAGRDCYRVAATFDTGPPSTDSSVVSMPLALRDEPAGWG